MSLNQEQTASLEKKDIEETPEQVTHKQNMRSRLDLTISQPKKKLTSKERQALKRKMAEENPYYRLAKSREIPPEKRHKRRKSNDFREVDDMHTAIYYFENGT
jgi:hypothetical protein